MSGDVVGGGGDGVRSRTSITSLLPVRRARFNEDDGVEGEDGAVEFAEDWLDLRLSESFRSFADGLTEEELSTLDGMIVRLAEGDGDMIDTISDGNLILRFDDICEFGAG